MASIQRLIYVDATSWRDVASTLRQRCVYVACTLGFDRLHAQSSLKAPYSSKIGIFIQERWHLIACKISARLSFCKN